MKPNYINVVFNLPIDEDYTYSVPEDLQNIVKIGIRVLVPFGKRNITGLILEIHESTVQPKVKPIIKILDPEPLLNDEMITFCKWMADYYFCPLGEVIFSAIPKSIMIESKILYSINEEYQKNEKVTSHQEKIIRALKPKPLTLKQIENKLHSGSLRENVIKLQEKNVIKSQHITTYEKVKPKIGKYVSFDLLDDFKDHTSSMVEIFANESGLKKPKQVDVLKFLIDNKISSISFKDLLKKASVSSSTINTLAKRELINIEYREIDRIPVADFSDDEKILELNYEQQDIINELSSSLSKEKFQPYLLFGVTGSGKTQVYIEVIKEVIKRGKKAIVLVPEIALTPQLIHRFRTNFGEVIGVVHSKISEGERFDVFRKIISGETKIVIGARSALFVPMKNIGIIIVDEEHDHSYKQVEKDPKYNARDAAIMRAKINNACVILGSATPSIESFFNAKIGKYKLLELPHRALKTKQPNVELINMLEERRSSSKYVKYETAESKFLSSALISRIGYSLKNNQSIILLQNRRGYSAYLECQNCGYVRKCTNCDITLIYHKYNEHLRCHYCGYSEKLPEICPNCESKNIILKGTGTEKVEEEITRLFPKAKIRRMDADTVKRKDSYRKILKSFHDKEFDILVGTQMISKGLDFPNVFLVGVISADVGLYNPDFRSGERTFQLLMQVSGRSGRASDYGKVIIQTTHPENYIFSFVQSHDYTGFYNREINSRKNFNYPPFSRMILIEIKDKELNKAHTLASKIYLFLNKIKNTDSIEIMKPAPAIIPRIKNYYRYHIIIKTIKYVHQKKEIVPGTGQLIRRMKKYLADSKINIRTRISIESDPLSFY